MIRNLRISVLVVLACFVGKSAVGQGEQIVPLSHNQAIKAYNLTNSNGASFKASNDTLVLPVVDDFSSTTVYPDPKIWLDRNVFINTNFPINAPTVGVATFDGLDEFGNAYDNSQLATFGGADTLTSCPINMELNSSGTPYSLSDSIFLSFYYQRKGLGDRPEGNDSLKLEFYDPIANSWQKKWSRKGGTDTVFHRVRVRVDNVQYLKRGFQFRFVNLANLTGNLDHWHIDYVRLKTNVTLAIDTILDDIAFTRPAQSLINFYTSVPYPHYKALAPNQAIAMRPVVDIHVKNNSFQKRPINSTNDRIFDPTGATVFSNSVSSNDIDGNSDSTYFVNILPYAYSPNFGDSAVFEVVHYLGLAADANRNNDTIRFLQKFYNYYAYDDGTAEVGYSINSAGGKIAYRFNLLKPDTLRAVQIHFTQINADVKNKLFKLAVWKDLGIGGGTEDLIYQKINQKPVYVDSVNGFATYGIPDTILAVSGTIYVGFIQNTADELNVGLDLNRVNNSRMFYNTTGSWFQSGFEGSWMIRPVFGDSIVFVGVNEYLSEIEKGSIYPNPTSSVVNFQPPENTTWQRLRVLDMTGHVIEYSNITDLSSIDLSHLKQGFYVLSFSDAINREYHHKLIISR